MIEILAIDLIGSVPEDEGIVVSTNKGEPIALNDKAKAGQEYRNIARRIMGEDLPMMPLEKDNFITRFKKLVGLS
jgi:septum site-determining protein MinD